MLSNTSKRRFSRFNWVYVNEMLISHYPLFNFTELACHCGRPKIGTHLLYTFVLHANFLVCFRS